MTQAEEYKAVIKWEQFSNFNGLVNTVAYVERALSKYKPAILVVSDEEKEKAKAIIFKFIQREQFGERVKSLKIEKEVPKFNNCHLSWMMSNKRGYYNLARATETIERSDGVIRSPKVRMNDGVYKRSVVRLTPVQTGKMFA